MTTLFDNQHIKVTIQDFDWPQLGKLPTAVVIVKRGMHKPHIEAGEYPFALVTISDKEVIDAGVFIQRYLTIVAHAIESDDDWKVLSSICNF